MTESVKSTARATLALAAWLRLFVLAVCLSMVAAVAWYEWSAHEATLARAETEASRMAASLAQHSVDTFELADVLLTTLSERIQGSSRTPSEIWVIDEGLAAQLRQAPRIRSIMAYDENGRQFISSQPLVPDWFDITRTEAFEFHRTATGTSLRIGKPVQSPTSHEWILPASRRLNKPDGSFGGVLVSTMRASYFAEFYDAFNVKDGTITLFTDDGAILSRSPWIADEIGANYFGRRTLAAFLERFDGSVRFTSPVDRIPRVYGYHRAAPFSLTVLVGLSQSSVLVAWLRGCVTSVIFVAGLTTLFGVLGLKLVRQVEARQTSEIVLSQLARTDGLTGLNNRRAFDEALASEWKASRASSMSLLLLDVDHFKNYNDTYGHLAGDDCLRRLAGAIDAAVYKPGDHVARYGGEEFAVILPDTSEESALVVAERIREAIFELAIPHSDSSVSKVVTVSIGVSTKMNPVGVAGDTSVLVADADRALYKAKLVGRNRVETSSLSLVQVSARI